MAADILLSPDFGHDLTVKLPVSDCLSAAARLAWREARPAAAERFFTAVVRCPGKLFERIAALGSLSGTRQDQGDIAGAVLAAGQAMRLGQEYSFTYEGEALWRLADCARLLDASTVDALVVLAEARVGRNSEMSAAVDRLLRQFGDVLGQIDGSTRERIEHDYRADRGARLLRGTFDVEVAEIDTLNERLGDATEDELRGFLLDVQQYCTRDEPTA
jgi:hypothetical protein